MQHVKAVWLRNYTYIMGFFDILGIAAFFWSYVLGGPKAVQTVWGITPLVAAILSVHFVYIISGYQILNKKQTWFANVISLSIWGYFLVTVIETSGHTFLLYRIGLIVFVFFMGLNGPFPPLAAVLLIWIILLLTVSASLAGGSAPLKYNLIVDSFATIAGASGWLFFKQFYVNKKTAEEIQLTSMLKEEQFKSSLIIESITDGVMIINTAGTVQLLNESASNMLGWVPKDALNLDYRSLIQTEAENLEQPSNDAISTSLKSGKSEQSMSLLATHHGHHIYVDIVASPIYQNKVQADTNQEEREVVGVIAVLRDVDEQKRQEQQRSDFISTASHEMRTPVASIQGFLELALNPKTAVIDAKAKSYLEKAYESTKHLGELFQDLLTVSKSEDGRLNNNPKLIEVGEFLKDIVEQDRMVAEQKGLKVSLDSVDHNEKTVTPLLYVNVDPDRLREVITDLFDNAVKYTPTGMITLGASLKEQGVVIRVSDTGLGIAEEDIPHLFQKFYRTDNTATREIGGTGLGLYICKQIVDMMGGKIWVESTVGAGSTFYVEIPRVSAEQIESLKAKQQ